MHLIVAIVTLLAAIRWGNWKNIGKYYPTQLYMIMGALLYLFIYGPDTLWDEIPDSGINNKLTILLYVFIVFPCTVLLYLSKYPSTTLKQFFYIAVWIIFYSGTELILFFFGKMLYNSGWNICWSVAFNCMMFPMLRLHFVRPFWAIGLSLPIIILLTLGFGPHW
jgi:hypothetical protein